MTHRATPRHLAEGSALPRSRPLSGFSGRPLGRPQPIQPMGLTARQNECLWKIGRYIDRHGYAPGYREIARALRTQPANAHRIVQRLKERGAVLAPPGKARAVMPTNMSPRSLAIAETVFEAARACAFEGAPRRRLADALIEAGLVDPEPETPLGGEALHRELSASSWEGRKRKRGD